MAATIIILCGAIIVTFLFVIMLAQQTGRTDADDRSREPALACLAGFVLVAALLYLLRATYDTSQLDRLLDRRHCRCNQDSAERTVAMIGEGTSFLKSSRTRCCERGTLPTRRCRPTNQPISDPMARSGSRKRIYPRCRPRSRNS